MANNVLINQGVGTTVTTSDRGSAHEQVVVATAFLPRFQATPVIDTAAYATGDCLGPLQTIASVARYTGGSGMLRSITIVDKTQAQRAAIDLVFFDRTVTTAANNAPFACSDADMLFCLGVVAVATGDYNTAWPGTPLNSVATKIVADGLPLPLSGTSLFVQAVVRGTPTYTSTSDIVIGLQIEQL
jgi:hypothetical protein